ncbi:MAG: SLC13 family permease [Vulcanisaeta sp. AZ3]|jgi:di/tricarboxylate transporter
MLELTFGQYYVLAVLILAIILLLTRVVRHDIVGALVLILLVLGGVLSLGRALEFFVSSTVVVLGSLLLISRTLEESGFLDRLAEDLSRLIRNEYVLLVIVLFMVALTSGFMSDVALVAIFMPFMYALSSIHKRRLSKYLMPLSYAAILGGRYTIFGTSTNLIVNQFWYESFHRYLSVFQFLWVGLAILFVGLPVLLLIYVLLPSRENVVKSIDDLKIGEYVIEAKVNEGCEWVGRRRRDVEREYGVKIVTVLPRRFLRSGVINEGSTLLMRVPTDKLPVISSIKGLSLASMEQVEGGEVIEALVTSSSSLVNNTIANADVLNRYGVRIVGISTGGRRIYGAIEHTSLRPGDALLLLGEEGDVTRLMRDFGLMPLRTTGVRLFNVRKGVVSIAVLVGATVASLLGVDISLAFLIAAVLLVLTGAINYRRVYQYVDWSVLVFIASFLSLGYAMSVSGLSDVISHVLPASPVLLFLITVLIANFVNNVSAAAIMTPIALTYPNPLAAVTVVAMASSTTFLTPFSHPANLLIYSPGGYRVRDYLVMGALIVLTVFIVTMVFTGSLKI